MLAPIFSDFLLVFNGNSIIFINIVEYMINVSSRNAFKISCLKILDEIPLRFSQSIVLFYLICVFAHQLNKIYHLVQNLAILLKRLISILVNCSSFFLMFLTVVLEIEKLHSLWSLVHLHVSTWYLKRWSMQFELQIRIV